MLAAEDLNVFFSSDDADACTFDGEDVNAILEFETVESLSGDALAARPAALIPTAQLGTSGDGSVFVARGVTYAVRSALTLPPDGALTRLILARTAP